MESRKLREFKRNTLCISYRLVTRYLSQKKESFVLYRKPSWPWPVVEGVNSGTRSIWVDKDARKGRRVKKRHKHPTVSVLRVPGAAWPGSVVRGWQRARGASKKGKAEYHKRKKLSTWSFAMIWLRQQLSYFDSTAVPQNHPSTFIQHYFFLTCYLRHSCIAIYSGSSLACLLDSYIIFIIPGPVSSTPSYKYFFQTH